MHWQIVEVAEQLTQRYVANESHLHTNADRGERGTEPNNRMEC